MYICILSENFYISISSFQYNIIIIYRLFILIIRVNPDNTV